jgi:hypothetical protein
MAMPTAIWPQNLTMFNRMMVAQIVADTVIKKEGQRKLPFNMLDKPAIKSS